MVRTRLMLGYDESWSTLRKVLHASCPMEGDFTCVHIPPTRMVGAVHLDASTSWSLRVMR